MYKLLLTKSERDAIDWIGYRYDHGDNLRQLLSGCIQGLDSWDDDKDLEFYIDEHIAWEIAEIGRNSEYIWDCLSDKFSSKLTDFCLSIV